MGDIEQQNDDLAASTKETPLSPPASGTRDDSTSIQGSIDSLTGDSRLHDTGDLSASLQPPVEEPHCEAPAVSTGNATAPNEDGNIAVTSLSREPVADSPLPPIPTAEATSEPSSPPSEDADAPSTLLEHSTLPEQEGNSVPLYAPVEQSVAEVVQKHVEIVEPPVKQDKGKGRAVSPPAPAQRRWSTSVLSPQKSDGLFRVPSMTLASSSGSDPAPLPRSPHITYAPKSGVGQISAIESADCDDYPRISNGLRTTYHKGMPPHKPRVPLSRVTGMSEYRRIVTKYAGEPLYQLSTALPYVLGPMFLITRLQLLVERKISLPDEVRELVARNGLDLASLSEYDVALLNVLGCLWDDWEPRVYRDLGWITQDLSTRVTHEATYTDQRLELYCLRRHMVVHRRACNILEFLEHIKRWRALPNPANVLGDDGAKTPWSRIVSQLRLLEVDFTKIDLSLYDELRGCEGNALTVLLSRTQQWQKSGELERRFQRWREEQRAAFERERKAEMQNDGSYRLRFSHTHPLGKRADAEILGPKPEETQQPEQMQLEEQAKVNKKWVKGCKTVGRAVTRCFKHPAWRYLIYSLLLGIGICGWAYSQTRDKGCGDHC